ncbi:L,D-transpeptidase [Actinotalea solisilvae]|uniref:L,D-transpeptidase n=1 Tax=Actinotalea solisilvae TaxID=2072922 RepID=UPI0018F11051|nr:L,D-transpeptidase [Actinotalea solisilvae]
MTAALAAVLAVVLAACSAPAPEPAPSTPPPTTAASPSPTPSPTPTGPPPSILATALAPSLELFVDAATPTPAGTLTAAEVTSMPEVPLTLLVTAQDGDRVQVLVPTTGATAWVAAGAVALSATTLRVEVRLAEHLLRVEDAGEVVLEVPVALGATGVPAPGRYSVTELLSPPAGGSRLGALAYGLSGSPPLLAQFASGAEPSGIHGGASAAELGTDGVGGGVRLLDADVLRLANEVGLPLGAPVDVVP